MVLSLSNLILYLNFQTFLNLKKIIFMKFQEKEFQTNRITFLYIKVAIFVPFNDEIYLILYIKNTLYMTFNNFFRF